MIATLTQENLDEWDKLIHYCTAVVVFTAHASTGETTFFLLKSRDLLEPTDLRPTMRYRLLTDKANLASQRKHDAVELAKSRLIIAQGRQKEFYDKETMMVAFKEGDLVLLKELKAQTGKFS